ncbi:hypothetical protein HY58_06125 [Flavihumibacter sp. ZG627]|nr:hypothetical protein HY58_06125 [Flavihumibacter sp. ZG627]
MFFTWTASAQLAEEIEIKKVIDQLFTGMRSSDTALLAGAFAPGAILQTIMQKKDGSTVVRTDEVSAFISSIGKAHKEVYDERISYGNIEIDANLAAVWTPYQFFVGTTFSHCGVNSFQLVKLEGKWKIQYLIDTRRKDGCL